MLNHYVFFTAGTTCMINDVMMVGQKKRISDVDS